MTSKPGKQTIAIHILPNISRSKGNETMEFCQLIEYNGGGTIPRPFSKKSKLNISLGQQSKVLCSLFLLHAKCFLKENISLIIFY